MESILAALEVQSFGQPVSVEFARNNGLISHTIFLVNGDEKVPVLSSRVKESGLPSFTELYQQGDVLFLTGADGPCHWSMSVARGETTFKRPGNILSKTFDAYTQQSCPFIFFDIACRVNEPVVGIRSQYDWSEGFVFAPGNTENLCTISNPSQREMGKLMISGTSIISGLRLLPEPKCQLSGVTNNSIVLAPTCRTTDSLPATLQWSYAAWRMA